MKEYTFKEDFTSFSYNFKPSHADKGSQFIECEDGWFKHVGKDGEDVEHWRVSPERIKRMIDKEILI